jgi:hypothetical protein
MKKLIKAKSLEKKLFKGFAVWTGLEPATSAVTGRHSNQLNYQTITILSNWDCKFTTFFSSTKYLMHFSEIFLLISRNAL